MYINLITDIQITQLKTTELKEEMDKSTIIVRNLRSPPTLIKIQKINKDTKI